MSLRFCRGVYRLIILRASYSNGCVPLTPAVSVDDERVQDYLGHMTGIQFDCLYVKQKEELSLPKYRLLTEEQLKRVNEEAMKKAKNLLKMTPVLQEQEEKGQVKDTDPRIDGFDDSKWLFTDISMGIEDKNRYIVVREPNGILREATWEERGRVCQIYFPKEGRKICLPTLLTPEQLPDVLEKGHHLHVLDMVCVQCEPDSSDYIRVHHSVYEHIDKERRYQDLYSTKHYGGLVWYLLLRDRLEGLITAMLERQQFKEAETLVKLYCLCLPNSSFMSQLSSSPDTGLQLIQEFCYHKGYSRAEEIVKKSLLDTEQSLAIQNHD